MNKIKFLILLILVAGFFSAPKNTHAATLQSLKDTITTSRPSSASPLSANASAQAYVDIYNNGSRYLASDSAKIMKTATGAVVASGLVVANQSADLTRVTFTSTTTALNGADVLIVNQTAMHTVQFTTANQIPSGGKIVITFPGAANTTASPSASTFAFNGLASGSIKTNNASTCSWSISSPSITCTTNAIVSAGTVVTFLIGCTSATGASCTTQNPTLINPTKSAAAGTADTWRVTVQTQDGSSNVIDSGTASIATIETVEVTASVDSTLTFTIAGIANATAVNTGNASACTNSELTNTGTAATSTLISLGSLPASGTPAISAQLLTITSNGTTGYSLTATSSGHLQDVSSGFSIADSTTPAAFPAATPWFGIHACGADVNTSTWGTAASTTTRGGTAKYGWPTQTTAVTLASSSLGPTTGTSPLTGSGLVTVEYAGAVDASVPAGAYRTAVTYVATPSF